MLYLFFKCVVSYNDTLTVNWGIQEERCLGGDRGCS